MPEYHYIQSEPGLWTVGTGTPGKNGDWEPESDHGSPEKAAARVSFLNGHGSVNGDYVTKDPAKITRTWSKKEVAAFKKSNPSAIFPDTVIWGIAINGICNPTIETLVKELARGMNGN
jgi:hypothetical protein